MYGRSFRYERASHSSVSWHGMRMSLAGVSFAAWAALAWPGLAQADAVTDWNRELQVLLRRSSANLADGPPEVAREMAIVTSSMFDAVNAASGLVYQPYAYTGPAAAGVSANAAALAAGYQAVTGIFNDTAWQSATGKPTATLILSLTSQYYATGLNALGLTQGNFAVPDLSGCASPAGALAAVCGGIALGATAGNAVLAKQAGDGSQTAILNGLNAYMPPGSGTVPGVYIPPNVTGGRVAMFPEWGSVTPMALSAATLQSLVATKVPGPPALDSAAYAAALLKTECQGGGTPLPAGALAACAAAGLAPETAAQAKAALFWNDPGGTIQPPGHWLQITNTVIQSQGLNLLGAARLSMLVSQAEQDAGIAVWGTKYKYNLWRPANAIRDCGPAGGGGVSWNGFFTACDPTWTSLIGTPPHPDYLAGHPAFSAAAVKVLENFFGRDDIPFFSVSDSYCNAGTALRGAAGTIVACAVPGTSPFAFNGASTLYSLDGVSLDAACADVGGIFAAGAQTCAVGGVTYAWSPANSGCNGIVNAGGTNDSPLICPITEVFSGFNEASTGPSGSEFSRVAGGIHTPFAVTDATALGSAIGQAISEQAGIPEPASIGLFVLAMGLMAGLRRGPIQPGA